MLKHLRYKHLKPMWPLKPMKTMPMLLFPLQDLIQLSWHLIVVSLLWSDGPFWFLHLLRVHNLTIMSSTDLQSRSPSQDFHDSQALQLHLGSSMWMASWHITPSSTAPRTLTPNLAFHQIGSGAISSAATIPASYTIKGAYFHICASTLKL